MWSSIIGASLGAQLLAVGAAWLLRRCLRPVVSGLLLATLGVETVWYLANWLLLMGADGMVAPLVGLWIPAVRNALLVSLAFATLYCYWDAPTWLTRRKRF